MIKYIMLLFCVVAANAQKITVAEMQVKIAPGATEELLYGFANGDRVIYSVKEINGKTIHETAVIEYPDTYKYKAYNIKKEKNREFTLNRNAVYKFRLTNTDKEIRYCNIKIQRVPASKELKNYNTGIKWVKQQDTVWNTYTKDVVKGYDTAYIQKIRKAVTYEKQYEEAVLDKSQRVESKASLSPTKAAVTFTLPAEYNTAYETKRVVAWAYWVGVGEESNDFWKQNRSMIVGAVKGVAGMYTSPLGAIAAGAVTNLLLPTNGEDVAYALVNEQNSKLFFQDKPYKDFDNGKGVAGYKRIADNSMLKGKYVIVLSNDNYVQAIDVNVKVAAIMEHKKFKDEVYTDKIITPRTEKKIVKEPQIVTTTVPVAIGN